MELYEPEMQKSAETKMEEMQKMQKQKIKIRTDII